MNRNRTRNKSFLIRLSESENETLEQKMKVVGVSNREKFARKMLLDGYVINVDLKPISELVRLTRNISNNINQVARRANECGCVYEDDVIDLLAEVNRLKPLMVTNFTEITSMERIASNRNQQNL